MFVVQTLTHQTRNDQNETKKIYANGHCVPGTDGILNSLGHNSLSRNKHTDANQTLRNINNHLSSLCCHIEAKW